MRPRTLRSALPSLLLAYAGVDDARDPGKGMLPEAFHELTDALAARVGDPFFGLHAAQALPRGACGIVEFVVRSAPTVACALEQLVRYAPLTMAPLALSIERQPQGGLVSVTARLDGVPTVLGRHGNELFVALFLRVARDVAGPVPVRAVSLAHARGSAPRDVAEIAASFGTDEIVFDASHVGVTFDASWLDTPVKTADAALNAVLAGRLDAVATFDPLRASVEEALRHGEPSLRVVAASLGITVSQLRQWLAGIGTTFRALVDETRATLARAYLDDKRLTVSEVAFLLGYADVRAFTRAHKRWTGGVPSMARSAVVARSRWGTAGGAAQPIESDRS